MPVKEPPLIPARCPHCALEYTIFPHDDRWEKRRHPAGGRIDFPCYECSLVHGRSPAFWIPMAVLFVVTFPAMWMFWTHVIGPILVVVAFVGAIWVWLRRKLAKRHPPLTQYEHR